MDNDSGRVNMEGELEKETQQYCSNAGNILQPAWLRRAIQGSNGLDRVLLDYGFNFLPYLSIIIYTLLLLI